MMKLDEVIAALCLIGFVAGLVLLVLNLEGK